jgi:hypothetical protein
LERIGAAAAIADLDEGIEACLRELQVAVVERGRVVWRTDR